MALIQKLSHLDLIRNYDTIQFVIYFIFFKLYEKNSLLWKCGRNSERNSDSDDCFCNDYWMQWFGIGIRIGIGN